MSRGTRYAIVAAAALVALALPGRAAAQYSHRDRGDRYGWSDPSRVAYDNGYREGLGHGGSDARSGRDFAFAHAREYQKGTRGYRGYYGHREAYREWFRRGYEVGYRDGYGRYAGPSYGRPGYSGPASGYRDPAFDNGFRDGYEKGLEDARDRDPYDPRRQKWYREGDRRYDRRYGPRERYKDVYRDAFIQGYDRGYREAQRYGSGGWSLGRWRWPF